ncbi:GGDEF domain-containing protein [Aureimonas fodinaquatilis]|uniref:GGDEF domain-containing protein n=1 Tax=Aureimonas fodinaquatilis TaxID=2565783 RepID=A0A5B0DVY5_9HYPH|nr:GGDEF domain-containing protein [Aureimonas fodinaquatilis]KAA0970518.1 GGDEF domain-containing protein [Aureimonas fodinaquatilis]
MSLAYSLPKYSLGKWLTSIGAEAPIEVRVRLMNGLYGTMPIFLGGVLNTTFVAAFVAVRLGGTQFVAWLALEVAICLIRVVLLIHSRKRALAGLPTPTDAVILFAILWAASVGYGGFISMASGDWVVATLVMMSSAAMIGGICIRNFGTPRLAAVMIILAFGPVCFVLPFAGQPLLYLGLIQIPFYIFSMCRSAFVLQSILVDTMIAERTNEALSRQDTLTNLLNRAGLGVELEKMRSQPEDGRVRAFMYLDLDGFKSINDSFGHDMGDLTLVAVSNRLQNLALPGYCVARIGGDEFVLVGSFASHAHAEQYAETVRSAISRPYTLAGQAINTIGVSIGVAFFGTESADLKKLLRAADRALYSVKRDGKGKTAIA